MRHSTLLFALLTLAISCGSRDDDKTEPMQLITYTQSDAVGVWKITQVDHMGGYGWVPEMNNRIITFKSDGTFTSTLNTPGSNFSGNYSISNTGVISTSNVTPDGWWFKVFLNNKSTGEIIVSNTANPVWKKYKTVKN